MLADTQLQSAQRAERFERSIAQQLLVSITMGISLTALYMFNGLQESVKADLHLSDFGLSLVEGVAVAVPLALSGIPVGLLVDRVNRVRVMIAMTLLWVTAAGATAWSPSLWILFASRVLAAGSGAALLTAAISLAADLSPPEHRGQAMQIINVGKLVGSVAAFPVGALLIAYFSGKHQFPAWLGVQAPWRSAHLALALFGSALAVILVFLREPQRHEVVAGLGAPVRIVLRELWVRRAYLAPLLFGQMGILMADAAATIWSTPILSRRFGLEPLQFAGWLALGALIAGVAGSIIGGWAADAGYRKFQRGGVLLGAVVSSAIAIPAALFPIMPTVTSLLFALTVLLLCGTVASIALMTVIGIYLPNETRGLAFGGYLAFGGLVGFGVAPTLVVSISSWLGGESNLAPALTIVGTAISVISFGCFLIALYRTPGSLEVRRVA
jgi:MFS family permease